MKAKGFTLIEILISLSIFIVVLATVAVALDSNRGTLLRGERKMDAQQNARLALGALAREIRMAGYFPENFADPAADPPLAGGLRIAASDALAIYGDADGSGAAGVYLYCLDGTVLRRGKGAVDEAGAYWCPGGEILAEDVTELRFSYYDFEGRPVPDPPAAPFALDSQSAGGIPEMSDVAERAAVRRVVVTITVTEAVPGQSPQVFSLGTQVRLRNGG